MHAPLLQTRHCKSGICLRSGLILLFALWMTEPARAYGGWEVGQSFFNAYREVAGRWLVNMALLGSVYFASSFWLEKTRGTLLIPPLVNMVVVFFLAAPMGVRMGELGPAHVVSDYSIIGCLVWVALLWGKAMVLGVRRWHRRSKAQ